MGKETETPQFKDPLTGLYNREFFYEELTRLERGRHFPVTLMVADLDDLRIINQSLGREAGDRLLRDAARVLLEGVRGDDVVARIAADEFAIILPDTDPQAAANVLERIRGAEAAFNRESDGPYLAISVGVATAGERRPLVTVLQLADRRMLEDKAVRKKLNGFNGACDPCRS